MRKDKTDCIFCVRRNDGAFSWYGCRLNCYIKHSPYCECTEAECKHYITIQEYCRKIEQEGE